MKKDYLAPELELITFSFDSILDTTRPLVTSDNENGGSDYNDDDNENW